MSSCNFPGCMSGILLGEQPPRVCPECWEREKIAQPAPMKYEEHHFCNIEDVGIAFNDNRLWVCINGAATFRAKVNHGKLFIEYYPPNDIKEI